ncbi:MAG: hemerythrin domain-containing protein [Bryobacterales bacterium]
MTELLAELEREPVQDQTVDWARETLVKLADHIVGASPRLSARRSAVDRLCSTSRPGARRAASVRHRAPLGVRETFERADFYGEGRDCAVSAHPRPGTRCGRASTSPPLAAPGGTVRNPIRMMEHEHDDAGRALSRMRELTSDREPPRDACNTFRALYAQLAELERDLHTHPSGEQRFVPPRGRSLKKG